MRGLLLTLVPYLAKLYPWEVDSSDDLEDAISYLRWSVDADDVIRAGFGGGLVTLLFSLVLLLVPIPGMLKLLIMLTLVIITIHGFHSFPKVLAAFHRAEALGQAPNLIGRIVLRMKIEPSIESAVAFAVDTGEQPLYEHLEDHVGRAMGTPYSGLLSFTGEWSDHFPAMHRSAHLLNTSQDAKDEKRDQTLDRSLETILDGTRTQMADFLDTIRGPTTALYAFGVMLPLVLVSLVPAVAIAGITVTIDAFVVLYNFIFPTFIIAVGLWLLTRRPVAFPPPQVSRAHPDIDTHWLVPFTLSLGAAGIGFGVPTLLGQKHLAPVGGIGLFLGLFLYLLYKPVVEVRDYIRDVESHLIDALYTVGRQVDENESVESAIDITGDRLTGATGDIFKRAAERQRRLQITVKEAFLGRYGVLTDIPSPRAKATASLLSIAAKEGQPAGLTIESMADHLDDLEEVEADAKRQLSSVTNTLQNTATYFGPMVAGATVGLSQTMTSQNGALADFADGTKPLDAELLALVVGIYIIMLSVLLHPLAIGLKNGLDRPLIGYRVGISLLQAVPVYIATITLVTGLL